MRKFLNSFHLIIILVFFSLVLAPGITFAQLDPVTSSECGLLGVRCIAPGGITNARSSDIATYLWAIIQAALALVATVTMGFLIYSGYLYIMSRGNEQDAARAKNGIAFALIGLAIIGLAGWLVNAVLKI